MQVFSKQVYKSEIKDLRSKVEKLENKVNKKCHDVIIGQWHTTKMPKITPGKTKIKIKITPDKESYNTNKNYFTKRKRGIIIHVAGYYKITGRTLVYISPNDWGHFYLDKNGSSLDCDHGHGQVSGWDDRHVNYTGYLTKGDIISLAVYHHKATKYAYNSDPVFTRLTIEKLD